MTLRAIRCLALHFKGVLPTAQDFAAVSTSKTARMKLDLFRNEAGAHNGLCTGATEGLVRFMIAHFTEWPAILFKEGAIDKGPRAALPWRVSVGPLSLFRGRRSESVPSR